MRWLELIEKNPTEEMYNDAWKIIFGYYPSECKCEVTKTAVLVSTPTTSHYHGGFTSYTDSPALKDRKDIWYSCGCTWDID